MPSFNRFERRFFEALQSVFVGAPVEGESGFINLMRIKSRYYTEGVFPRLKEDIDRACAPFAPEFREELFDKLYDFFRRYFSESGSIYFRHTPLHSGVYEKVYTDDRDVILFWKTHMLYYVKTDRQYRALDVTLGETVFHFDVDRLEYKRANEKRELVYTLGAVRPGRITLEVQTSEKGRRTRTDEILRDLKAAGVRIDPADLERACRIFEKQSEVDYFINKNAGAFLKEQFDLWLFQYLFAEKSDFDAERLRQLQALKDIAGKIIDFIAQFEDELARAWNKPRFVLNSRYIITIDKITDPELLPALFAHPGMAAQLQEWRDLGMTGSGFTPERITARDLLGAPAEPRWQHLPLDTRHFPDLEGRILAQFEDLDAALDGRLVHSENYQALNTLLPKFREKVQAIFIDPPYNTGNDDFQYNDKFQHSSWLTMMENRLILAREFLKDNGAFFATLDDIEISRLRLLTDAIFGENNFIANVVWQKKQSPQNDAINFSDMHDYVLVFAKLIKASRNDTKGWQRRLLPRKQEQDQRYLNPDNDPRGVWTSSDITSNKSSDERPNLYYAVINPKTGEEIWPSKRRVWRFEQDLFNQYIDEHRIWWGELGNNFPRLKRFKSDVADGIVPSTWWRREDVGDNQEARRELRKLFPDDVADAATPKPVKLIKNIIEIAGGPGSITLDFFAGSGTTAHAVIDLNREDGGRRRYILVEMGEHFHSVILPRVKKAVFSDRWKDGKAGEGKGVSHFAKYFDLEQYEDTLRRARYADADLFAFADPYRGYVFLRDLKLLDAIELDRAADRVRADLESLYPGIDLAETLACVAGKGIRRIDADTVTFQDGATASLTDPDWALLKPLLWW